VSFAIHDKGLLQEPGWDIIYRHAFVIDSSGKRLAMGSTSGNLWVSRDGGQRGAHLPPIAALAFAP
jgi:hypothetical protein